MRRTRVSAVGEVMASMMRCRRRSRYGLQAPFAGASGRHAGGPEGRRQGGWRTARWAGHARVAPTAGSAREARGRVERRPDGRGEAAADPPAGAAEAEVRHGREALLVLPQGEQEMGDAVAGREIGGVGLDAPAVHAPAAGPDEQRARLPDDPDTEPAPFGHDARMAVDLA